MNSEDLCSSFSSAADTSLCKSLNLLRPQVPYIEVEIIYLTQFLLRGVNETMNMEAPYQIIRKSNSLTPSCVQ